MAVDRSLPEVGKQALRQEGIDRKRRMKRRRQAICSARCRRKNGEAATRMNPRTPQQVITTIPGSMVRYIPDLSIVEQGHASFASGRPFFSLPAFPR